MTASPTASTARPRRQAVQQLATTSWLCPVLIIALNFALQPVRSDPGLRVAATQIFALAAFVLAIVGFAAGTVALLGMRRHGRRGILGPALAGSIASSLYLAAFVVAFARAV